MNGNEIKSLLIYHRISQVQVAKKIGIERHYLCTILSHDMSKANEVRILRAIDEILTEREQLNE